MAKSNLRNGTSGNSDNTNRIIVMRRSQVQDRSVKKSSLHGSTTWNWRCRSGNENRSSEERRNYVKFDFLLPHISDPNDYDHVDYTESLMSISLFRGFVTIPRIPRPYRPSVVCRKLQKFRPISFRIDDLTGAIR